MKKKLGLAVLLTALADKEPMKGASSRQGRKVLYTDPRICDLAASAVARRLGDPSLFDAAATLEERDRRLRGLQQRWRDKLKGR